MVKLTNSIIMGRVKQSSIENLRKLNVWGCDIDDISILENMVTLEILSLSVNRITSLKPLAGLRNLKELYLRKNDIEDLAEVEHLRGLKKLRVLWLDDNPVAEDPDYRKTVLRNVPGLKTLDNRVVKKEEVKESDPIEDLDEEQWEHHPPTPHPPNSAREAQNFHHQGTPIGEVAFYTPVMPTSMTQSYHPVYQPSPTPTPHHHPVHSYSVPHHHHSHQQQQDIMSASVSGYLPSSMTSSMMASYREPTPMSHGPPPQMDESWICFDDEEQDQATNLNESFSSRFGTMRRSLSSARTRRSRSMSPTQAQRIGNVMTAIFHLLDELDADGLRGVVDECHDRIKKQR